MNDRAAAPAGGAALSAPFDAFERYQLTGRVMRLLHPSSTALRILDVGGFSSLLKHFLPEHMVVAVDVKERPPFAYRASVPFRHDAYVRTAGGALPFEDETFDVVTAHDTLEHVPGQKREAFLQDLFRVSRRFVILNGPLHDAETAMAEGRVSRFWRQALDEQVHALTEHLEMGLPERGLIERVLALEKSAFTAVPNGNLMVWLTMMTLKYYIDGLPDGAAAHEALDRAFNTLIAPRDFGGRCYREAFVVAKRREDSHLVERVQSAFAPLVQQEVPGETVGDLEQLVGALQDHLQGLRARIARVDEESAATTRALQDAREELGVVRTRLADRDVVLEERDVALLETQRTVGNLDAELREVRASLERIQSRSTQRLINRAVRRLNRMAPWGTRRRSLLMTPVRALRLLIDEGFLRFLAHLPQVWVWLPRMWQRAVPAEEGLRPDDRYAIWVRTRLLAPPKLRRMRREARSLAYRPLISVVVPTYNSEPAWLRRVVRCLKKQAYRQWELCLADDGSTRLETRRLLRALARRRRIKVAYLDQNRGISAASNAALALATGDYVAFMDHDDELKPNALFEVARMLNERRNLDFIYSDEDKMTDAGDLIEPFFKPGWSADFLMSANYLTHLNVFRRGIVEEVGCLREGFEGSQDYDLALRVTERTDRIAHIPVPLYSWRQVPGSAAQAVRAKPYAYEAAKRALGEALGRRGHEGEVLDTDLWGTYRVRYAITGRPFVSIIIPTRDRLDLLRRCVGSIRRKTSYQDYEIVLVDNESEEPEVLDYLHSFEGQVARAPGDFSFSKSVNSGARAASGDVFLILHDETEVIDRAWIESLLEHAQRGEIAAVGPRLLWPHGPPQHEGMVIGPDGGLPVNIAGGSYFGLDRCVHNVSAVSGACLMTRAEVFDQLNGLDEALTVAFADADYCLRALDKGYRTVYTPYARLYHDEGARNPRLRESPRHLDALFFRQRWQGYRDPYYNPNLSLERLYELGLEL
jgi:GT2 family glycosyltransferase